MTAQPRNDRVMKWLLGSLITVMLACASLAIGATLKANGVENRQEATELYLRETLTQIQQDVREIRQNQTEMMRNQP